VKTVDFNINRLNHLMELFGVTKNELISYLNGQSKKLKNPISDRDIFSSEIKISNLKKIDKLFNKGLNYYLDPKNIGKSKEESIFFRKTSFNAKLNIGAKRIVNKFEEEKISFSTLAKLSDLNIKRTLPVFKISDNPKKVSSEIKKIIKVDFCSKKKDYLNAFINVLADNNVLVFEFIEHHNTTEKANIEGFYLSPNVIVLKRSKYLSREIFTLAHELGHYLLNKEEIDDNVSDVVNFNELNDIERWCNDFAYYFLIGNFDDQLVKLEKASVFNDFHDEIIESISNNTHLSTISLYTRLLFNKQISPNDYNDVKENILIKIKDWEEEKKRKQELEKARAIDEGRKQIIPPAKAIISPLYKSTLQIAYNEGLVSEREFCVKMNIKPEKLDKFLL
jgi:Zn-dependent peptidase ImmA (M78 family)